MKSCWAFIQTNGVRWLKKPVCMRWLKKPVCNQKAPFTAMEDCEGGFAWMVYAPKQVNMIIR